MYFNKYDKTAMSLTGQIVAMKMYTIIFIIWQIQA